MLATDDVRWTCSRGPHFLQLCPPPRLEDMDDRCCCGTVLIGVVVSRQAYDWTTAVEGGHHIALLTRESAEESQNGLNIKNVERDVGRRFDSTLTVFS